MEMHIMPSSIPYHCNSYRSSGLMANHSRNPSKPQQKPHSNSGKEEGGGREPLETDTLEINIEIEISSLLNP